MTASPRVGRHASRAFHRRTAAAAVVSALAASLASAEVRTLTLTDHTGRGFLPDLVSYRLDPPADPAGCRMHDEEGRPVAVQLTAATRDEPAMLHFVASIPNGATVGYRWREDGAGDPAPPGVRVDREESSLVLRSKLLAVRVPAEVERIFDDPPEASTLPAPILAFQSGDHAWIGRGRMLGGRRVTAMSVRLAAVGPVFAEAVYELRFVGGGHYRASVRVVERLPLAKVREEYDAGELDGSDYWELDLTRGWSPDTMETATCMGNSGVDRGKTLPLGELGATPDPITARWGIVPDSAWHGPRSYIGLFRSQDREKIEARDGRGVPIKTISGDLFDSVVPGGPLAGFVPLHKGDWRRTTAVEIHTGDAREVRLRLPLSVRRPTGLETTSETSANSMHEHDPSLPATLGRRVWGLVLALPEFHTAAEVGHATGPFMQARIFYGIVGLDRYKDFILDWPQKPVEHPRVFLRADDVPRYREHARSDAVSRRAAERSYLAGGDPAVAGRQADYLRRSLPQLVNFLFISPTLGHHRLAGYYLHAGLIDDVLSWPDLPDAERAWLRQQAALLTHMFQEPDTLSYGNGTHTGPSNMGTARAMSQAAFMALLPDHPMFDAWREHMTRYVAYKMGTQISPGGAYFEFGGSYHMHGYGRTTNALAGLLASGAPGVERLFTQHAQDWRYYMNLLTPHDSRWLARVIPGLANAAPGCSHQFLEASGTLDRHDPHLAAELRWAWHANGQPGQMGDAAGMVNPYLDRPWIEPRVPALGSGIYPGLGVVFRAHQGPDETWMMLRSGYHWSHWYIDQGHYMLMSRGAVLVPFQPYQYWHAEWGKDQSFDRYNVMRFGGMMNLYPPGWPDSNVLDHAFLPAADYAWSSSGYPSGHFTEDRLRDPPGQEPGELTHERQVVFLKSERPRGPNYFVFRDGVAGSARLASWMHLNLIGRRGDLALEGNRLTHRTEWDADLDILFPDRQSLDAAFFEENQPLILGEVFHREAKPGMSLSPNWVHSDGERMQKASDQASRGSWEQHVFTRIAGRPGEGFTYLLWPRDRSESPPNVRLLAPGAVRVETPEGVDVVLLAPGGFTFEGQDVTFEGRAGVVRRRGDEVTVAMLGGSGRIGFAGRVYEGAAPFERSFSLGDAAASRHAVPPTVPELVYEPVLRECETVGEGVTRAVGDEWVEYRMDRDAPVSFTDQSVSLDARRAAVLVGRERVRFVAMDGDYVRLSAGRTGVRGRGPFDLTFTPAEVRGTVRGDTRTLVASRPAKIVRPMFEMDGLRWAMGFDADPAIEQAPAWEWIDGGEAAAVRAPGEGVVHPRFNMAVGVTAGDHEIRIAEWAYPPLPAVPPRRGLDR